MKLCIVGAMILFVPIVAMAQGGPPFRSDDPDTPGNHHWEINTVFVGERSPFVGSYEAPDLDVNYGLGGRIQLKYELPLAVVESRGPSDSFAGGLGNSFLGVKYRYFERHFKNRLEDGEREIRFSLSTYPQLLLSNPTRSVARGIVPPGPQMLIPLEASATIRWLRLSAETGYWVCSKDIPNAWIRGVVAGHEFGKDTEMYAELYDQQNVSIAAGGTERLRDTTLGLGGRIPIVKGHWLRLIGLVGHGLVTPTIANGQPSWIASFGLQFLSDKRRRHGDE